MHDYLRRAIEISRKTGDRLIVVDSSKNDEGYVVIRLDEYEKIVNKKDKVEDLTEGELIDKINRDIAFWKDGKNSEEDNKVEINAKEHQTAMDEDIFYFEDEKEVVDNRQMEAPKKGSWKISSNVKEGAEEVIE